MARLEAFRQAGRQAHLHKPRAVVYRHALGSMTKGQRITKAGLQPRTAVLSKTSHANCHTTPTNRPSRGRRGRFVRVVQQLACEVFARTAVHLLGVTLLPMPLSQSKTCKYEVATGPRQGSQRFRFACSTEKSGPSADSMELCLWTPGSFSHTTLHKSGHAKQKYENSHARFNLNASPFNRISQVEFRSGVVNQTKL